MKNSKQLLNLILLISSAALVTACGSTKEAGSIVAASSAPTVANSTSGKPLAFCNEGTGKDISAKLKAFTDSTNTVRMDYVMVKLTSVPEDFGSNNSYLAFRKWLANSNGSTAIDKDVSLIALYNAKTGQALTDWKNTIRWSDVSSIASTMGAADAKAFFANVIILVDLKDLQGSYDVLKIVNYDVASNNANSETDALLPLFNADPADYAKEESGLPRAQVLQGLHPFKNLANQGFTSAQFQSMASNMCF